MEFACNSSISACALMMPEHIICHHVSMTIRKGIKLHEALSPSLRQVVSMGLRKRYVTLGLVDEKNESYLFLWK